MVSIIISGGSTFDRLEEAKKRASKLSSGVDLVVIDEPTKISEAREIIALTTRKPYQSKAISIILNGAEGLTIEAQNALLKTLEEPPASVQLFLTSADPTKLLPTVRSRCHLINLGASETAVSPLEIKKAWRLYLEGNLSKLFDEASEADLGTWLEMMRQLLVFKLGGEPLLSKATPLEDLRLTKLVGKEAVGKVAELVESDDIKRFLSAGGKIAEDLSLNINKRLALENLFLLLPAPKVAS